MFLNLIEHHIKNKMAFDQFQRYKMVQIIVNSLKEKIGKESVSILEIGGNNQCNLGDMLPKEQIQYSNDTIPDELKGNSRFIAIDGTNMPEIKTDAYDIVIALDVFEHIDPKQRENFLNETYRVAKYITILCFPFANGANENAERRLNNYYKAIYGRDHIWLKEHIENGLPVLEDTENILKKNKIIFNLFQHGDSDLWEEQMKALFCSYDVPGIMPILENVEELYCKDLYFHDIGENNYRVFLSMMKSVDIKNSVEDIYSYYFKETLETGKKNKLIREVDDLKSLCKRKVCRKIESNLYIDTGNGYSEETKLVSESFVENGKVAYLSCKFKLPENVVDLRFDPIQEVGCIVSQIRVDSDHGSIPFVVTEGLEWKGGYVFPTIPPQLIINLGEHQLEWIKIDAIIDVCYENKSSFVAGVLEQLLNDSVSEKNRLLSEKDDLLSEKNNEIKLLSEKIKHYEERYIKIIQSKSWKITAPFRKLVKIIKRNSI